MRRGVHQVSALVVADFYLAICLSTSRQNSPFPPSAPPPLPHHISEEEEMFLFPPPPSVYYGGMYADCLGYGADDTNARGQGMRIIM